MRQSKAGRMRADGEAVRGSIVAAQSASRNSQSQSERPEAACDSNGESGGK